MKKIRFWNKLLPEGYKEILDEDTILTYAVSEHPIRSVLFSADEMKNHGKMLAGSHVLNKKNILDYQLLLRLEKNEKVLLNVRAMLALAIKNNSRITPAGEWLLDNFYLIEEQIRTARRHFPKGFSKELPRLKNGPSAGLPRVYDLALETISHGDGRVDIENLSSFIKEYQTVNVLKLGELWAIPIMLRLALIENLRRVALRIASNMVEQNRAGYWADRMTETAEKDPSNLILVIAEMVKSDPPLVSSFVAELSRRLQGQGLNLSLALAWFEQRLSESGLTIKHLVQSEIQQQAADQVSMSNSIGSLRFLGIMDWHEFVETMSIVNQTLKRDPSGDYDRMDFATRDLYRHAIEKIAKKSILSEVEVAQKAIFLSKNIINHDKINTRLSHVGYYLIDKGFIQLKRISGISFSFKEIANSLVKKFPLLFYTGTIAIITFLLSLAVVFKAQEDGFTNITLGFFIPLTVLSVSSIAVALVNRSASFFATPQPLPRLDFSKGIPAESRTLTIVPSMLLNLQTVDDLVEALEVKYLANRDDNLYFALLTDFPDAEKDVLPSDAMLLHRAQRGIEELNTLYSDVNGDRFFLFHRPRLWNPKEKIWMGRERKRGKINDLNAFLRGSEKDFFSLKIGQNDALLNIKYIITLDADTRLPRDSARRFIETMSHPLNEPLYDEDKGRIVEGYGIIQPGIAIILQNENKSRYAQLCGSEPGVDPYTKTVSDLYQDLFHEGSFIGKGIYDIDAFELAMKDKFPDNLILSHDLIEGCYGRSGLLSDVQLIEENPVNYITDVNRRKRWIRGDWQILKWILPFFISNGTIKRNKLSPLSKWKIFDNLRRSLVAPALFLLLTSGWLFSSSPWFWTIVAAGIIIFPSFLFSLVSFFSKHKDFLWSQHFSSSISSMGRKIIESMFNITTLPYEAFYSITAVLISLWRLITGRHLLEWNSPADRKRSKRNSPAGFAFTMLSAPLLSIALTAYFIIFGTDIVYLLSASLPFLMLWFVSPVIAWYISKPLIKDEISFDEFSQKQQNFLLSLSRKTWAFFERFMGPEDNWLPPDNYQEDPLDVIAHRTSPTNIGLALLSNVTACDFGYITTGELIERTSLTLNSMEKLQRYENHFYNWYDTFSLEPLPPLYISTVDSGNLAAYLLILRTALHEIPDKKIIDLSFCRGLRDTIYVLEEHLVSNTLEGFTDFKNSFQKIYCEFPRNVKEVRDSLQELVVNSEAMVNGVKTHSDNYNSEIIHWLNSIENQCKKAFYEFINFYPWSESSKVENFFIQLNEIPTINNLFKIYSDLIIGKDEKKLSTEDIEICKNITQKITTRFRQVDVLMDMAGEFAKMKYEFLYNKSHHLFAIGYNVSDRRRDSSYYDLLASEARLCSFVAIAQGQIPQDNWFALGRQLTTAQNNPVLLSWSGSMFEYLMPLLIMPEFKSSLLGQTYKTVIDRQIEYGKQRNVPWGISESGYYLIDAGLNYQYRAFGVPGLGLKRGLADDLVIAPYATGLALMVDPVNACKNLQRLSEQGFEGRYGLYEAVDYSISRIPHGNTREIIKSYMVHHQGMSFLSFSYLINDRPMQKRFNAEPLFTSASLLLQERIPKARAFYSHTTELPETRIQATALDMPVRFLDTYDTIMPEIQLLSNGKYRVMITNSGGGNSCWNDVALTRWREDSTCDNSGSFCYIKDIKSGEFWSTTYQPTLKKPDTYEVIFSEGKAEFRRSDNGIESYVSIVVSPEDDIELRRTRITNQSKTERVIEMTTYSEVVIASQASDVLHPAFGNLFVQTQINHDLNAILCHRRPRSASEETPWFFQLVVLHGAKASEISYETDRAAFIGRWNTVVNPDALTRNTGLSESEGSVLDPIVSIRHRITLKPDESATFDIVSGIGESRDFALQLIEKYHDRRLANRVFDLAWTHSQVREILDPNLDTYGSLY